LYPYLLQIVVHVLQSLESSQTMIATERLGVINKFEHGVLTTRRSRTSGQIDVGWHDNKCTGTTLGPLRGNGDLRYIHIVWHVIHDGPCLYKGEVFV
jgi:hypothetical protein